jgi:hypothetical protein
MLRGRDVDITWFAEEETDKLKRVVVVDESTYIKGKERLSEIFLIAMIFT